MIKKIYCLLIIFLITIPVFAEKLTMKTGDFLAFSMADYFFPTDINMTGNKCSVTSIKNVNKNLWCISIATIICTVIAVLSYLKNRK